MPQLNYQRTTIRYAVAPEHALPQIAQLDKALFVDSRHGAGTARHDLRQGIGRAVLHCPADASTLLPKTEKPGKLLEIEKMKDGRIVLGDHDLMPSVDRPGNCDIRGCTRLEYDPTGSEPRMLVGAPGRTPRETVSSQAFGALIKGMYTILDAGMIFDPRWATAGQLTRDIIQDGHPLMIPDARGLSLLFSGEPR